MCVGKEGLVEWAKFQRWVWFMVWGFGFRSSDRKEGRRGEGFRGGFGVNLEEEARCEILTRADRSMQHCITHDLEG
jgi:hypothetical protein